MGCSALSTTAGYCICSTDCSVWPLLLRTSAGVPLPSTCVYLHLSEMTNLARHKVQKLFKRTVTVYFQCFCPTQVRVFSLPIAAEVIFGAKDIASVTVILKTMLTVKNNYTVFAVTFYTQAVIHD